MTEEEYEKIPKHVVRLTQENIRDILAEYYKVKPEDVELVPFYKERPVEGDEDLFTIDPGVKAFVILER